MDSEKLVNSKKLVINSVYLVNLNALIIRRRCFRRPESRSCRLSGVERARTAGAVNLKQCRQDKRWPVSFYEYDERGGAGNSAPLPTQRMRVRLLALPSCTVPASHLVLPASCLLVYYFFFCFEICSLEIGRAKRLTTTHESWTAPRMVVGPTWQWQRHWQQPAGVAVRRFPSSATTSCKACGRGKRSSRFVVVDRADSQHRFHHAERRGRASASHLAVLLRNSSFSMASSTWPATCSLLTSASSGAQRPTARRRSCSWCAGPRTPASTPWARRVPPVVLCVRTARWRSTRSAPAGTTSPSPRGTPAAARRWALSEDPQEQEARRGEAPRELGGEHGEAAEDGDWRG